MISKELPGLRVAMFALKSGLNYGSGFYALAIPNSSCARVALDRLAASVAAYLWSHVALVVYL